MDTLMLRTNPRKTNTGTKISYEVLGVGNGADALKETIRTLENYPAASERRAIVDVLGLIASHNYRICYTERTVESDGLESWTFILQG